MSTFFVSVIVLSICVSKTVFWSPNNSRCSVALNSCITAASRASAQHAGITAELSKCHQPPNTITGTENNPADIIENGVLRASPVRLIESESACVGYLDLTTFKEGRVNFSDFQSKMGKFKTSCLQILVTRSQARWITIREIAVFIQK